MNTQMDTMEKLRILSDAAKYDAACTSSGVNRAGVKGQLGSAAACGICHSFASDGRCISLLKVLMSNDCVFDCAYCVNRCSNEVRRAAFTPQELADLTGLPTTLSQTGRVKPEQFDEVASTALNDGAIIVNPAEANHEEIVGILREVWA